MLGKDINDGGALNESPSETITEEIWKRILSNISFFLKTKGTAWNDKRFNKLLWYTKFYIENKRIWWADLNDRVSYEIKRKFTYFLDFKSSEHLKFPYQNDGTSGIKPETIEFRFRVLNQRI